MNKQNQVLNELQSAKSTINPQNASYLHSLVANNDKLNSDLPYLLDKLDEEMDELKVAQSEVRAFLVVDRKMYSGYKLDQRMPVMVPTHMVYELFDYLNCLALFVAEGSATAQTQTRLSVCGRISEYDTIVVDMDGLEVDLMTPCDITTVADVVDLALMSYRRADLAFKRMFVGWYYGQLLRDRAMIDPDTLYNFMLALCCSCRQQRIQSAWSLAKLPDHYRGNLRKDVHAYISYVKSEFDKIG